MGGDLQCNDIKNAVIQICRIMWDEFSIVCDVAGSAASSHLKLFVLYKDHRPGHWMMQGTSSISDCFFNGTQAEESVFNTAQTQNGYFISILHSEDLCLRLCS